MHPFSRILVPIDFSIHSAEAIRYAADLSRRYEANVTLVHVYMPGESTYPGGHIVPASTQYKGIISDFEKQLASAKVDAQTAGALHVDTKMLQGVAAAEIVAFAQASEQYLIVMGTHGRKGIGHALLGSVAEKVVRTAHCPVLTVRAS